MPKQEIEFISLNVKERKILLDILGIDLSKVRCHQCDCPLTINNISVMPCIDNDKIATVLCEKTLCMAEWITKFEAMSEKEINDNKRKMTDHLENIK